MCKSFVGQQGAAETGWKRRSYTARDQFINDLQYIFLQKSKDNSENPEIRLFLFLLQCNPTWVGWGAVLSLPFYSFFIKQKFNSKFMI